RTEAHVLSDYCLYWTSADFDETKDRLRAYLTAVGLSTKEVSRRYGPRIHSYFFGRFGARYLRVEVMLESNNQVAVNARVVSSSQIEHDYTLRNALEIEKPNKAPEPTPGSVTPRASSP